jgi:hypothetical protein
MDIIVPISQLRKVNTERLNKLPKIAQLVSGRASIQIQVIFRVCAPNKQHLFKVNFEECLILIL